MSMQINEKMIRAFLQIATNSLVEQSMKRFDTFFFAFAPSCPVLESLGFSQPLDCGRGAGEAESLIQCHLQGGAGGVFSSCPPGEGRRRV